MVILYGSRSCSPVSLQVAYEIVNNGIQFAWEAFFPLFAFTSTELGGLGLGVRDYSSTTSSIEADTQVDAIGMVMAVSAGLSIFMTVFVFPYLHHRIPENLFLRLCPHSTPHRIQLS